MQNEATKRAYNLGSDARIAGKGQRTCPYAGKLEGGLRTMWLRGWNDVDTCWGRDARVNHYVHKLPPVGVA